MTHAALLSPAAEKPPHVPEALVYDFDMFSDPEYLADPHGRIQDLLAHAPPVLWTPRNGGHWMFLSYAANFAAARDTQTFSSEQMPMDLVEQMMKELPPGMPRIPLVKPVSIDPPQHGKYRRPLQRVFSPQTVNALAGDIEALADELIGQLAGRGRCEFMSEVAEPLPVQIFLKMMGLPADRQNDYRALVKELLLIPAGEMDKSIAILQRIVASMREVILDRRERPGQDIISLLWSVEIDGKPPTLDEVDDYCVLLFIAGLDTVMNGIGHGVHHLARTPELQAQVRGDPAMIPELCEELLRRYSFVVPNRRVTGDTVFDGVDLKGGDRVMLFLPAADLDGNQFPDPGRVDLARENKAHLVFNAGPHRCLGSHLARLELQITYRLLLERLPEFRLDPDRPPVFHCGPIIGVDSLHLVWA